MLLEQLHSMKIISIKNLRTLMQCIPFRSIPIHNNENNSKHKEDNTLTI